MDYVALTFYVAKVGCYINANSQVTTMLDKHGKAKRKEIDVNVGLALKEKADRNGF